MKRSYFSCLMYHELVERPLNKFSVTPQVFEAQMKELVRTGCSSYILDNEIRHSPDKYNCMITFDDGHISNLKAAHLMTDLGLTAYFYLIRDFSLSRSDYLSENDIKEISSLGHKIGVHGKSHDHWARMEEKRLVSDLKETKDWIEQLTGQPVITCSAPGGVIDERTIDIIKREIPELKYIRTSRYGINHGCDTILNSIGVHEDYSLDKVVGIAKNDKWTMFKIMSYYHTKELLKPMYHFFKKR